MSSIRSIPSNFPDEPHSLRCFFLRFSARGIADMNVMKQKCLVMRSVTHSLSGIQKFIQKIENIQTIKITRFASLVHVAPFTL